MKHHSLQYILRLIAKNSGGKTSGLVPVRYLQVTPDMPAPDRWLFLSLLTSGNYAGLTPVGAFPWNHRPVRLVLSCTYLWMVVGLLFFHISIDRGFNWLSSYVKHIVVHGMWIYLESKTGSISYHTQPGTLYP